MNKITNIAYGNDNDTIERLIASRAADGIVVIPKKDNGDAWILDRAILLPANTTIILKNCSIKLSDKCRDNFFRTDNCGTGIEYPEKTSNIHIIGIGKCVLEGADKPRATGDSSKLLANPCPFLPDDLCRFASWIPEERRHPDKISFDDAHSHSFGSDYGKEGETQHGNWKNIGILFANIDNFSIENITISHSHGWGISIEAGTNGRIEKIHFNANMSKEIDGIVSNIENEDGIDIRNGCSNIIISDITGITGDDVIALTAIAASDFIAGGSENSTHVMHNDWTKRKSDIHDIIIKNVIATSAVCWLVRLLPAETNIYNVIIDNIIDTAEKPNHAGAILLGEGDGSYGRNLPDSIKNITISNVISNAWKSPIIIAGYLSDSSVSNVINKNLKTETVEYARENCIKNVLFCNMN